MYEASRYIIEGLGLRLSFRRIVDEEDVLEVHKKELSELNCRYAPATVREIVQ
jgi:hypothetical protein